MASAAASGSYCLIRLQYRLTQKLVSLMTLPHGKVKILRTCCLGKVAQGRAQLRVRWEELKVSEAKTGTLGTFVPNI